MHENQPRIGHLSVDDAQVSPDDLLDNIIKGPDGIIEAHVRGIVERPPIDCYQNACVRLKITPSPLITSRLHQQRTGTLNLSGLGKLNVYKKRGESVGS
jgi:hypothetical protein